MNLYINHELTERLDKERGDYSRVAYALFILNKYLQHPTREEQHDREETGADNRLS